MDKSVTIVSQCIKPIREALCGRPIISIPFHCRNYSRPNDPQAGKFVESCQRLIIEISTGQWISPMRDREAEACARVSSRKAARIRSASSRYLPVERISPLPPPSPSPDMNCYEINRACIYNIYIYMCVYILYGINFETSLKLWIC